MTMPINTRTHCTTAELTWIVALSRGRLSQLENAGIISRTSKDSCLLAATVQALLDDARAVLDRIKADRERLWLMKECHEVCYLHEFDGAVDAINAAYVKTHGPLPARIAGRDFALRSHADKECRIAQQAFSDEMKLLSESLRRGNGKAASSR